MKRCMVTNPSVVIHGFSIHTRYLNRHVYKYFKGSGFVHVMKDEVEKRQGRILTEVISQNTLRSRWYLAVVEEQVPYGK